MSPRNPAFWLANEAGERSPEPASEDGKFGRGCHFGWIAAEVSHRTSIFLALRGCCPWGCPCWACTLVGRLPTRWQSPLGHHSCACRAAAGSELAGLGAWGDREPAGWEGSTGLPWGVSPWAESGGSQPSWFQRRHTSSSDVSPSNISNDERRTRDRFPLLAAHILAVGAILPNRAPRVEAEEGISAYAGCLVAPPPQQERRRTCAVTWSCNTHCSFRNLWLG